MGMFGFPSPTSQITSDKFAIDYLRLEMIHPRSLKPKIPVLLVAVYIARWALAKP